MQKLAVVVALLSFCALSKCVSALPALERICKSEHFWDANQGGCNPCPAPPDTRSAGTADYTQQLQLYQHYCDRFSTCCSARLRDVDLGGKTSEPPSKPPTEPPLKPTSGQSLTQDSTMKPADPTVQNAHSQQRELVVVALATLSGALAASLIVTFVSLVRNFRKKLLSCLRCHLRQYQQAQADDSAEQPQVSGDRPTAGLLAGAAAEQPDGSSNDAVHGGVDNGENIGGQVSAVIVYPNENGTRMGVYADGSRDYETVD